MKINFYPCKTIMAVALMAGTAQAFAQYKPTANNDVATTTPGQSVTINVLANDTHPQGKQLEVSSFTTIPATSGSLVKNPNHTFTFIPAASGPSPVSFTYTIKAAGNCPPTPHTYQYIQATGITWADAKVQAELLGGYLATITCPEENDAVQALFSQPANAWIGGSDMDEEGIWKWMTGPEAGQQFSEQDLTGAAWAANQGFMPQLPGAYSHWSAYEPNSENYQYGNEEDFAHIYGSNGYWNDLNGYGYNGLISGFVVEYGGVNQDPLEYTSTATVTINITAPITQPTIIPCTQPVPTIIPFATSTTYTGGTSTNIYLGYGPQSVTLYGNPNLSGICSYAWKLNGNVVSTNQWVTVAPTTAGNYVYTLTVTKNGCSASASTSICVRDIRVPNQTGKVYLCHVPPGNPNNPQTLSISVNAVSAHLGNHSGDRLGSCNLTCGLSKTSAPEHVIDIDENFEMKVYPNPNTGSFQVEVPFSEESTTIRVYDVYGKLASEKVVSEADGTVIRLDMTNVAKGVYFVEVQNEEKRYSSKIMIQ